MRQRRLTPEHGGREIDVLVEDEDLIVVNKPAGLPTANAPRGADSLFVRLTRYLGNDAFVGVVSRLDRPVSGVVVFAKTRPAAASLAEQFRGRTVTKKYLAVVERRFPAAVGDWVEWQDLIGWDDSRRRAVVQPWQAATDQPAGCPPSVGLLPAVCLARVVCRLGEVSLVELRPTTGRKHQLRAQLSAHGSPIVGDRQYGARLPFAAESGAAVALHASAVTFDHPRTGLRQEVSASVPSGWQRRFSGLFAE